MNTYERINAIGDIAGYVLVSRSKSLESEFVRAKAEAIKKIEKRLHHIKMIDFATFKGER